VERLFGDEGSLGFPITSIWSSWPASFLSASSTNFRHQ